MALHKVTCHGVKFGHSTNPQKDRHVPSTQELEQEEQKLNEAIEEQEVGTIVLASARWTIHSLDPPGLPRALAKDNYTVRAHEALGCGLFRRAGAFERIPAQSR